MHIQLAKAKDLIIDLDAPLATSVGRPVGNKAAKVVALETATADRVQASIDKCLVDVSSTLLMRDTESDERWKVMLLKQEEKIVIRKERVAVKKRKGDFMILTADTTRMDPQVLAAHMFCRDMILK
jgi:hypothetical protein